MTEYEMLCLIIERRNEGISLLQWWGAISVGIIAASHFIDRTLNLFVIVLIVSFYLLFSFFVSRLVGALFDQLLMAFSDLAVYAKGTEAVSQQTKATIQVYLSGKLSDSAFYFSLVFYGLTIATCSYPIWKYLSTHKLTQSR